MNSATKVYQTQCNNLLFAMPMPYGIGNLSAIMEFPSIQLFHCNFSPESNFCRSSSLQQSRILLEIHRRSLHFLMGEPRIPLSPQAGESGIAMDSWSIGASFRLVALFQAMADKSPRGYL